MAKFFGSKFQAQFDHSMEALNKIDRHKLLDFFEGRFLCPVPDGPTDNWSNVDWVNYIDLYGKWLKGEK